ncbi:Bardet-Biedl syndrome 2 protein [Eumeta japonica]|uniref:Bardet-Biedl syndrome 2 protein n=1 Tax=Eumeta variegata TaxID=151549 RepID=A0A4C1V9V0_EUMVA|nr:Bardet-Biedl syndrome 2 protein [Eumeta japonica]
MKTECNFMCKLNYNDGFSGSPSTGGLGSVPCRRLQNSRNWSATTASFPEAENNLREEMVRASELCETRSRLATETAERAQLITALLPAAQDVGGHDMKEMLNRYKEVVMLNEEILVGCHARRATHEQAVDALKKLHTVLQHAAKLRVGKYNKAVVTASRKAVKDNDTEALIKILQIGDA